MNNTDIPPVCDYEGSDYRTRFWEGQGRNYEDQVERIALRRLMPPTGGTLIEIGAGFGRLADEYLGYQKVVLFDYSRSLLREAQAHLGNDPRFVYVAGNWYQMPFVAGLFDTMVQIRTLHHAADVPALFQQLARIARPNGRYILEFANKQNLKAILRYGLRRQQWSPFALEPIEFVALNYDFHPRWIRQQLKQANFSPGRMLTVSHYRFGPIKKTVPTGLLVGLDSLAQWTGNWWQLSPSVFVDIAHPASGETAVPTTFFACPHCQTALPEVVNGRLTCPNPACHRQWAVEDNLYDFKEPVA
ncbi:MAG: class I SAM-dependent methyltransferase [Candidatus Promineifilaceae bacterium]|nr:class I SAM-dependent methyltransferase [Anaerolineaceae bacterium]